MQILATAVGALGSWFLSSHSTSLAAASLPSLTPLVPRRPDTVAAEKCLLPVRYGRTRFGRLSEFSFSSTHYSDHLALPMLDPLIVIVPCLNSSSFSAVKSWSSMLSPSFYGFDPTVLIWNIA